MYDIGFRGWKEVEEAKLVDFGDSPIASMAMAPADSQYHDAKSWTMMFVDTCG